MSNLVQTKMKSIRFTSCMWVKGLLMARGTWTNGILLVVILAGLIWWTNRQAKYSNATMLLSIQLGSTVNQSKSLLQVNLQRVKPRCHRYKSQNRQMPTHYFNARKKRKMKWYKSSILIGMFTSTQTKMIIKFPIG